jgi:hypothetical protein
LRRVSRRLLPQSLHASESRAHASAAAELKDMLKEAGSEAEASAIRAELAAAERGAVRGSFGPHDALLAQLNCTLILAHMSLRFAGGMPTLHGGPIHQCPFAL